MNTFERTVYQTWRACPRCKGSGQGRTCQNCVRCSGVGGRFFDLYASELTNQEINNLPVETQVRISIEIDALMARNAAARSHSEGQDWESTHNAKLADGSDVPETAKHPKRKIKAEPEVPTGREYRSVAAWEAYLRRMDRFEAQNGNSSPIGKRSYGLKGQRLVA